VLSAFLAGTAGGLLYCLPVSAVNAEIIRRGLTDGFRTSFIISLGAIVGDVVWLTLAVLGAEAMLRLPALRLAVGAAGTLVLLALAIAAWRTGGRAPSLAAAPPIGARRAFGLGALLCLASPFAVPVLLAVIASVGAPYAHAAAATRAALYAGVFDGALIYGLLAASISSWGARFITPRGLRLVDRIAAVLFFGLAVLLAWQTVTH
jgi:threonine/homoserine/homoserine lactone efflux protein